MREFAEQTQRYRESKDEGERAALKTSVREKIGAFYDRRIEERKTGLERMEKELSRLRREIEEQDRMRDQAIDERVRNLLDGAGPPPRPQP